MKVVINRKFGGADLSIKGMKRLAELKNSHAYPYDISFDNEIRKPFYKKVNDNEKFAMTYSKMDIGEKCNTDEFDENRFDFRVEENRTDKDLVQVIEEMGEQANSCFSNLKIVNIPDDSYYKVQEYDGMETLWVSDSPIEEVEVHE